MGNKGKLKEIAILHFDSEWRASWDPWRELAGQTQVTRVKTPEKLASELEFGLLTCDTLVVFPPEGQPPAAFAGTVRETLTAYTGEPVSESPLDPGDAGGGTLLRSGTKTVALADPNQGEARALLAAALAGKPAPHAIPTAAGPPGPRPKRKFALGKWPARGLLALLILGIALCGGYYASYYIQEASSDSVKTEVSKLYHDSVSRTDAASVPAGEAQPLAEQEPADSGGDAPAPLPMVNQDRFASLLALNPDTIGWLQVPGTDIDYAVTQTDDQSFYLTHDIKGNKNVNGNPFLGAESHIGDTGTTANITIYAHNNKNQTMFGTLSRLRDLGYLKQSPLISFDTLYGDGEYEIVAIYIANVLPAQDDGQFFDFGQGTFKDDADFNAFVAASRARSLVNTGTDVKPGDQLLTLVTCTYEFSNARLVVLAREVRPGEDTGGYLSGITANPAPLYPQVWYDKYGGTKPPV